MGRRTNAGQHQDARAFDRARTQRRLTAHADIKAFRTPAAADAVHPARFDHQPLDSGGGQHAQVGAIRRRGQKRRRRRGPPPLTRVELDAADAVGAGAIVIGIERNARQHRRRNQRVHHRMSRIVGGHPQRAARTMKRICAPAKILGFLEIGQHIGPIPSPAPCKRPGVIIHRVTAHIDHAVHRRMTHRSPFHAASRSAAPGNVSAARWNSPSHIPTARSRWCARASTPCRAYRPPRPRSAGLRRFHPRSAARPARNRQNRRRRSHSQRSFRQDRARGRGARWVIWSPSRRETPGKHQPAANRGLRASWLGGGGVCEGPGVSRGWSGSSQSLLSGVAGVFVPLDRDARRGPLWATPVVAGRLSGRRCRPIWFPDNCPARPRHVHARCPTALRRQRACSDRGYCGC